VLITTFVCIDFSASKQVPPISTSSQCQQLELQAKLLNYFLGSNKSNINQRKAVKRTCFTSLDKQWLEEFVLQITVLRWGWVFFKSRLQNNVRRFGRGLAGLFSQQILLNLIKRCSNQHAEIFINETNMRRFESVFTNQITSS